MNIPPPTEEAERLMSTERLSGYEPPATRGNGGNRQPIVAAKRAERERPRFKSAAAFCAEYVPLAYVIEGIMRSASLYTLTAKTGAGKTAFNIVAGLAVATGRTEILGVEVTEGRVAYIAAENPDDCRMRIMIAAFLLHVDIGKLEDRIVILDRREKPEAVHAELARLAKTKPFALVLADTLAALPRREGRGTGAER